jgi:hypothetical protein
VEGALAAIVDGTLAAILADRPPEERARRREALRSLFEGRSEVPAGYRLFTTRCSLCDVAPLLPLDLFERGGFEGVPPFVPSGEPLGAIVCTGCLTTDYATRDADVAAVIFALDEPTGGAGAVRARDELKRCFEKRTVKVLPHARCDFCAEEGPVVEGYRLVLGTHCLAKLRRRLAEESPPTSPEEAAARRAARERRLREEAAAIEAARERRRQDGEMAAKRPEAEALRRARLPAWRRYEEDALRRACKLPVEKDRYEDLRALKGVPSFPPEIRAEARRVAARARRLRARLPDASQLPEAPRERALDAIAAVEREALNGYALQKQPHQSGRNVERTLAPLDVGDLLNRYRLGP